MPKDHIKTNIKRMLNHSTLNGMELLGKETGKFGYVPVNRTLDGYVPYKEKN